MKTFFRNTVLAVLAITCVSQLTAITVTQINNEMEGKKAFLINSNGTFPIEAKGKINITPFDLEKNKEVAIATSLGVYVIEATDTNKVAINLSPYSDSDQSSQSDLSAEKVEITIQDDGEITVTGV